MFLGHFGVAFAAKRLAPQASLGTAILAAQLLDLAWPVLVLAGVERVEVRPGITRVTPLEFVHYPWSHSLLMVLAWSAAFGAAYALARRDLRAAAVLAALVASHWLLDWLVHRPDLPLYPGEPGGHGLGAWNSLGMTLLLEIAIFVGGALLYAKATRPRDRVGRGAFVALVAFLGGIYAANLFGPPPPSAQAIGAAGLAMGLLVAWGYWIDRHRTVPGATP